MVSSALWRVTGDIWDTIWNTAVRPWRVWLTGWGRRSISGDISIGVSKCPDVPSLCPLLNTLPERENSRSVKMADRLGGRTSLPGGDLSSLSLDSLWRRSLLTAFQKSQEGSEEYIGDNHLGSSPPMLYFLPLTSWGGEERDDPKTLEIHPGWKTYWGREAYLSLPLPLNFC